jgi:hypothetical protein
MSLFATILRVIVALAFSLPIAGFVALAVMVWPTARWSPANALCFVTCVGLVVWLSWLAVRVLLNRPNRYGTLLHPWVLYLGGASLVAIGASAGTDGSPLISLGVAAIAIAWLSRRRASKAEHDRVA